MNLNEEETHEKIYRIRKEKRLSQTEIAELLGISQNAYSRMERGETKLTVDRVKQIADVLEVPYESLMGFNPFAIPEQFLDEDGNTKSNSKSPTDILGNALVKATIYIAILVSESYHAVIQLRKEKNLSQSEIAKQLGISKDAYSRIETGEVKLTYDKLTQIAKILGTDYETIVNLSAKIITSKGGNKNIANSILERDNNAIEEYNELAEDYKELEEECKSKDIIIKYLENKIKDLEKKTKK